MILNGVSYSQCTACSPKVIESYKNDGYEFLEKVFNNPDLLEELTGLKELLKKTQESYDDIYEDEDGFDLL